MMSTCGERHEAGSPPRGTIPSILAHTRFLEHFSEKACQGPGSSDHWSCCYQFCRFGTGVIVGLCDHQKGFTDLSAAEVPIFRSSPKRLVFNTPRERSAQCSKQSRYSEWENKFCMGGVFLSLGLSPIRTVVKITRDRSGCEIRDAHLLEIWGSLWVEAFL